jgi:CDP-glucose 4,6-dehydratase
VRWEVAVNRVLVTGATGFVGSALVSKLLARGFDVVATSSLHGSAEAGDGVQWLAWRCERPAATEALLGHLRTEEIDTVIHLAAVARPSVAMRHPAKAFAVNMTGTVSLLEAVRRTEGRVRRTVVASTALIPDADPRRWQPYFVSKRCADELSFGYRRTYGMAVSVVRLATVYGPGDRDEERLVPSVISDIRRRILPQVKDPQSLVDLIYIDDVIAGILKALELPGAPVYDLSGGALVRATDVGRFLEGLARGGDDPAPRRVPVITAALNPPAGWAPTVSLRTGLTRTLEAALPAPHRDIASVVRPATVVAAGSGAGHRPADETATDSSELAMFYAGRRVLVTGSTGFKGSWLALWLTMLGAKVTGFSLAPPGDQPSHFELIGLGSRIRQVYGDITDQRAVADVMRECKPDVVFHLAAQPLVKESISNPVWTFQVNTLGTVNLLEAARQVRSMRAIVCVTSDKCYQNQQWVWGYRETDPLGGDDPYSASKAAAELAIAAFRTTVYPSSSADHVCIASARAGNVIGGGDWAVGRLVPDIVRWALGGERLSIRNPTATRPWQHVLEPLSGYLSLGCWQAGYGICCCSSWNFGPSQPATMLVSELATRIAAGIGRTLEIPAVAASDLGQHETNILRLDSQKASQLLGWQATWTTAETIDATVEWYTEFYRGASGGMTHRSEAQITAYREAARERGLRWARACP